MHCLQCGEENPARQKFCGECGNRLTDPAPADLPAPEVAMPPRGAGESPVADTAPGQGERKQVTVLFCDVVESTPMAARLGADRMRRVLNEFFTVALREVHRFEGDVNQFLGDGFMVLFGAPRAQEDHSRRAAFAALAIRDAVAAHSWTELPAGERLRIRVGLDAGVVVFGAIGDSRRADLTAIGDTANVASRLQGEAMPNQIICSARVARAVEDRVHCRPLGMRMLKGKHIPVDVFEMLARHAPRLAGNASVSAAGSRLIGRAAEWELMRTAIARLDDGIGGVINIAGEAGVGKSRLIEEARRLAANVALRWVQGTCAAYGASLSYWPFREVMRACLDIAESDGEASALRKIDRALENMFGAEGREFVRFIAVLLGMHPADADEERVRALEGAATGHQIFRVVLRVVERLASTASLTVVLDDWHWADGSSKALLEHLLPLAERVPVLFIIALRPQARDAGVPASPIERESATRHQRLELAPLAPQAARELLAQLVGGSVIQAQFEARLLRRAEGNPFYLGEMVRTLVATNSMVRDPKSGEWRGAGDAVMDALPAGIEGVILARVDRLPGAAKEVLKIAAVVGRRCHLGLLRAMVVANTDVDRVVATLIDADLLEDGGSMGERELTFRHPLIREAVYGSLLDDSRRRAHRSTGLAMERVFADRIEEHYPILAHHFARAEDWDKAQEYLILAGTQATGIAADAEALEHLENALRHAAATGRQLGPLERAQLGGRIAEALYRLGRHDAALEHALGALEALGFSYPVGRVATYVAISRKLGTRILRGVTRTIGVSGRRVVRPADPAYLAAAHLFEVVGTMDYFLHPARFVLGILTMLEQSEARPLSRAQVISTAALGLIVDSMKLYSVGRRLHARAGQAARELGEDLAQGYCNHFLGLHHYTTGQWDEALRVLDLGARQLEAAGHLRLWASCIGSTYFVLRSQGDPRWMNLVAKQLDVGTASNDEHAIAWATNAAGVAHLYQGDHRAANGCFEAASEAYEKIPDYRFLSGALARRALCHALAGETEAAIGLLARSAKVVRTHRITGMSATAPLLATAEAYLCLAEQAADASRRSRMMRSAGAACSRAARHARDVGDESAAEAARFEGLHAWIGGDRLKARRHWEKAIAIARDLGANYVLARAHHEIGARLDDAAHADTARQLFAKACAAPLVLIS